MKITRYATMVIGGMLLAVMHSACGTEQPSDPPSQSTGAEIEAEIFARGIVSSELPEFATSFSPDGQTVFFNRMPADRSAVRIWSSTLEGGEWSEPAPLPFSDGRYRDVDPFVSPDGSRLYFSSTRPLEGEEAKEYDLWFVEREGDGWGEPTNLGATINSSRRDIYSTLSRNGNLYFSVFENEGDGVEIYRAVWQDGLFLEPERLVVGDGTVRITNPTVAPDESYLLFVSDHDGNADIYVSRRLSDGGWAELEGLGPAVNSEYTEFAPSVSSDGRTLFFTSERPGMVPESAGEGRAPGDIYSIPIESVLP